MVVPFAVNGMWHFKNPKPSATLKKDKQNSKANLTHCFREYR